MRSLQENASNLHGAGGAPKDQEGCNGLGKEVFKKPLGQEALGVQLSN